MFGKRSKSKSKSEPERSDANALDDTEKEQFAEWLELQDPIRRKHYLKLAQAYGFSEDAEDTEDAS